MKSTVQWALVLAFAAAPAWAAEDTYRSIMPDGSVRYGDSPAPGARSVKRIPPPPASTGTVLATPDEKDRARNTPLEPGRTAVIPMPERPPPAPAAQGKLQAPEGLPKRSY